MTIAKKNSTNKNRESKNTKRPKIKIDPPQSPPSVNPPLSISTQSLTVKQGVIPPVQTVVYIHGINNKPMASILKCQWDHALFDLDLGDRSRMAYWVNRHYYPEPLRASCADGDMIEDPEISMKDGGIMALAAGDVVDEEALIAQEIGLLTQDEAKQQWLGSIAQTMLHQTRKELQQLDSQQIQTYDFGVRAFPLPSFMERILMRGITRLFIRDVNDFFFHPERREQMEQSLIERLDAGGGPFVVIAHSQGSMIAYNVLRQLSKNQCDVRLFVTIGSPLGIEEVKDVFKQWIGSKKKLPVPDCVDRWVNVAERLDPVAADNDISDEYRPHDKIKNYSGLLLNPDSIRHPHSATGYLKTDAVRREVGAAVGNAFQQAVGRSVIARDLANSLEDSPRQQRHHTLIQLATDDAVIHPDAMNLNTQRKQLIDAIEKMIRPDVKQAEIEPLRHYVSARLTRSEIEQLRTQFSHLNIKRVWRDAEKTALLNQSIHTVQAHTAHLGYAASGKNISWAVLDTGIRGDHPHFERYNNIVSQWDCTKKGPAREIERQKFNDLDRQGHGTHVAGIIAGYNEIPLSEGDEPQIFSGIAPQATLYGFKVLDDVGNGRDSWIIKALDHIAELNEKAGQLVIQGVNLSLGGAFDPSVYGCGHTPICQELRRLWHQGVLVCLAAGNEGYAMLQTARQPVPANMDLSIGDPANLEEAIAVGSIHKSKPHTYGVSFFSSRGPTADGRRKPDLVAPGESILSAYHGFVRRRSTNYSAEDLYIEMSGTSMAAPHVSGILAAFLSVRREFIGYPDKVKKMLLENCTDLERDPYIQGYGMPNLVKMLANS